MKKKIFALIAAGLMLSFGSMAMAENQQGQGTSGDQGTGHMTGNQGTDKPVGNAGGGDSPCPGCEPTVNAAAHSISIINGDTANVTLSADATASGKDSWKNEYQWVDGPYTWHGWNLDGWHLEEVEVFVSGEADASARTALNPTSDLIVLSNSPQTTGLAYTDVHATTTLHIDGDAKAKGTYGCLQTASINVDGSITAYAYGNSFSGDPIGPGAYASAVGSGLTTVKFTGHEQDASTYGYCGNKAYVDFDTIITVDQHVNSTSYVNAAGTRSTTMSEVRGGYAESKLGRDCGGRDNIQLTSIESTGAVSQQSRAIGGGAVAYGSSSADFSGAYGSIEPTYGRCSSPGQTAIGGGHAVVTGYNNVDVSGNSITVTSVHTAYATTGNSGPAPE